MRLSDWCGIAISLLMASGCAAQCGAGVKGVEVSGINAANNQITLLCPGLGLSPAVYQVTGAKLQERLPQLHPEDRLTVWTSGTTLQALVLTQSHVAPIERWILLGLVVPAWLIVGLVLSRSHLLSLIMGEDGRYSNSKFQAVAWFSVLIVFYTANVILRGARLGVDLMGVSIPQNLLLLSGLSAFSFAAAKGITTAKVQDAVAKGAVAPKGGAGSAGLLVDLTTNDANQLDLGDFQMLVIVLIAVVYYLVLAFTKLGALDATANPQLPDVDTTILATFGLGQGTYLIKKAVGEVGKA